MTIQPNKQSNYDLIKQLFDWQKREPNNQQIYKDILSLLHTEPNKNTNKFINTTKHLIDLTFKQAFTEGGEFYHLYKQSMLMISRYDFDTFLQYIELEREPESRFYLPRRDSLFVAVQGLQDLIDDKLDLLSISMPPGTGKLLADDTPVLTTKGWKNHGDLRIGDEVFNHLGQAVKVTHVFPKNYAKYEITFSNGEKILAHGEHEWVLHDRTSGNEGIVETKELLDLKSKYGEIVLIPSINPLTKKKEQVFMTDMRRVTPVKGNCIEVEGGIYLVGETMIPTHNSTLGIFFLSWVMGKFPLQPNLASAHGSKLTRSFYDGVMEIMTDPEYLYKDVFPNNRIIYNSSQDETIMLNQMKRFKTLTCRSIDGSLTGATRCEKVLYADDLVSGSEEALSKPRMDSLWMKYVNDLRTRKKEGCKEVHVATRWSVHDVIGRLEREYGDDPRARFLVLPALNEKRKQFRL